MIMKELRIELKRLQNGMELKMIGELQFIDAQEFITTIPEKVNGKGRYVVLNLKELRFIDSSGLGAILYVSEACRLQEQLLQVINASPQVLTSLRMIKNVGTFELHET
jgi:anti-anti-sigma factor